MNTKELTLKALLELKSNVSSLIKGEEVVFEQFGNPEEKRRIRHYLGICYNFSIILWSMSANETGTIVESTNIIYELFNSWDKFSGSEFYPVPSSIENLHVADIYDGVDNIWIGEYGRLRIELLDHMIATLQSELLK